MCEAGLLDGRPATTHWAWCGEFAARFPQVALDPGVLYIDAGPIVTSAGTAASLDCCLHLLRQLVGAELAWLLNQRVARARRLLEAGDLPIEAVAAAAGFASAVALRKQFAALLGTSPSSYPAEFRGRVDSGRALREA